MCSNSYGAALHGSEAVSLLRRAPVPVGGGDAGGDKRPAVTFGARLSPTTAAIAAAVARVAALAHCAATFAASAAANAAFAFAVATAVGVCGINWFEWFAANGAVDAVDTTFVCARLSGVKNIS